MGLILDTLPLLVWIIDPTGELIYTRGKGFDFINSSKGELIGGDHFDLFQENKIFKDKARTVLDNKQVSWVMEYKGRILEVHYLPYKRNKKVYGFGISLDVTEKQKYLDELIEARKLIRRSMKFSVLGETTAKILHDLNNYIMIIRGYIDLIKVRNTDPEIENYLKNIETVSESVSRLPTSLLDFLREDMGTEELDLVRLLEQKYTMFQSLLPNSIELIYDIRISQAIVLASERDISQVLMNLILNARDAISETGEIVIRVSESELDLNNVVLSVIDSGRGIDPEVLPHIFEPLYSTKKDGNGLGLAIVNDLVDFWGAKIDVESQPKSTKFSILFPKPN